jgi:hypothetical protein
MAISDVLTVELGSRPAIRTRSSNAQYSKLQPEREAARVTYTDTGTSAEQGEEKQKATDWLTVTHQTMTADGVASFTVGSTYLKASTENPVHVSPKAWDRVT